MMPAMTPMLRSMLLVFAASVIGSLGMAFLKMGSAHLTRSVLSFVNPKLVIGIALFLASSVFYAWGIKDGQLSVLEYTFKNHRLFLTHTEVPPALESQGLGTALAHAALEYARQNELTVVAICPFVQEYVGSHPEYQSFVTTSVA